MTQLPPKALAMDKKWPSFGYQAPSWINDFIDFSSSKRNNHRRSSSDPIAFVETPFINECGNSNGNDSLVPCSNNNGFDRLDDEQLSSMFSDEYTKDISLSILSPCDQSSDNEKSKSTIQKQQTMQLKNEPGEVEDEHEKESVKPHITFSSTVVDPKRVKRILANRQSAQRSRVRKLHYVSDLERSVTTLQTEVSTLSPRVAFLDHQRLILNVDNSSLKQRIAVLAQDKIFKDAHQEALKKEIERLRRVYQEQNMNKTDNTTITTMFTHPTTSPPRPPAPSVNGTDEG